jgi:hypothetical protein
MGVKRRKTETMEKGKWRNIFDVGEVLKELYSQEVNIISQRKVLKLNTFRQILEKSKK